MTYPGKQVTPIDIINLWASGQRELATQVANYHKYQIIERDLGITVMDLHNQEPNGIYVVKSLG